MPTDPLSSLDMVQDGILERDTDQFCFFIENQTGSAVANEFGFAYVPVPATEEPKATRETRFTGELIGFVDKSPSAGGDNTCQQIGYSRGYVVGPMPFGGMQTLGQNSGIGFQPGRSLYDGQFGSRSLITPISGRLMMSTSTILPGQRYQPVAAEFPNDLAGQASGGNTRITVWGAGFGFGSLVAKEDANFILEKTIFSRRGTLPRLVVFFTDSPIPLDGPTNYDLGSDRGGDVPDQETKLFSVRGNDGCVRVYHFQGDLHPEVYCGGSESFK